MIALVDYGVGNLRSVEKAFATVGANVTRTSDRETILTADKVVLPGVGAFGDGMAGLRARGLVEPLLEVAAERRPILGICLGMQLLFEESDELGTFDGLGLLQGKVRRFELEELKVPHTGWNQLQPASSHRLLEGLPSGAYAYFNHGYYCAASEEDTLAYTEYGIRYGSVVGKDQLFGVQFHPEKSQQVGLTILRNFSELA